MLILDPEPWAWTNLAVQLANGAGVLFLEVAALIALEWRGRP